jgi:TonB-linked SusC/RagA family outer membrane protein
MKFYEKILCSYSGCIPKFLRVMKIVIIILTTAIMHVCAAGYAQKITLNEKNTSIDKVFDQISTQTGYDFFYSFKLVDQAKPVSINVKNADIDEVLKVCFRDQPFTYSIKEHTVIIKPKTKSIEETTIKVIQALDVTGKVLDEKGKPLPGASVKIKGTTNGTVTNAEGAFKLTGINENAVLEISFIGYSTTEVKVEKGEMVISLNLQQGTLNQVVVTALGINRSTKSLSYNVQQVNGDDLTTVKQTNFINSLSGKVAGVTISPSVSGVGGSAKVNLRGNRSVNGSNQPLYVVDGIPLFNASGGQPTSIYGSGARDGGDGISNLNPEDIASMSILDGASASALYGSQAQNGVILITTKKGKAGKTEINFNTSYQASQTAYRPKFQNSYGPTPGQTSGDINSWGPAITQSFNNLDKYFQTGNNFTNAVNLTSGNDAAQTYVSYANTTASGIMPTNKLTRNNLNLRETSNFFNNKLTVDASVNYINQTINNSPPIGVYPNPLLSLYLFPRGVDITPYKDNYYNTQQIGQNRQNWLTKGGDFHQENPWWIINNEPDVTKRNRYIITASAKYTFSDWLNLQVRGNIDRSTDDGDLKYYQGTDANLNSLLNGFYSVSTVTQTQKYADAIANFKIPLKIKDFKIGGLLGASITDNSSSGASVGGNLLTPDYFVSTNIVAQAPLPIAAGTTSTTVVLNPSNFYAGNHTQLQSVFTNLDLSYKDWAFITGSFRQDWSSTLAFTNSTHYNYPSIGLSLVLSQMTKLPDFISFAKVRGSYTEVGSTIPLYLTNILNSQNGQGSLVFNTNSAESTLKPERTGTFETGTDLRFLQDRLNVSFTYYKTLTTNQYFAYTPPVASLVGVAYYNAGKIQNTGYEFIVGYDLVKHNDFSWNTSINGSANKNKILEVRDPNDMSVFNLTANTYGYSSVVRKGGSYGDIYAQTFVYDAQGRMELLGSGTTADPYRPASSPFQYVGNPNPKFQGGWSNNFTYKNFNLSLLVDGKFGGQVMSITQAYMDFMGVSEETGEARAAGGVHVNGVNASGQPVTTLDPKTYYQTIGARSGMAGAYMYSATVVRLREAALGYNLPIKHSVLKDVKFSLTGRNLFYFYKKAPYDPELTMSTSNGLAGVDAFNLPATRDIGLNINATF